MLVIHQRWAVIVKFMGAANKGSNNIKREDRIGSEATWDSGCHQQLWALRIKQWQYLTISVTGCKDRQ